MNSFCSITIERYRYVPLLNRKEKREEVCWEAGFRRDVKAFLRSLHFLRSACILFICSYCTDFSLKCLQHSHIQWEMPLQMLRSSIWIYVYHSRIKFGFCSSWSWLRNTFSAKLIFNIDLILTQTTKKYDSN
jgi:hypothetical protein